MIANFQVLSMLPQSLKKRGKERNMYTPVIFWGNETEALKGLGVGLLRNGELGPYFMPSSALKDPMRLWRSLQLLDHLKNVIERTPEDCWSALSNEPAMQEVALEQLKPCLSQRQWQQISKFIAELKNRTPPSEFLEAVQEKLRTSEVP